MKKYIIAIALAGFQLTTHAQNQLDALRYSNLNYNGSARFNAMGGAFTAIGGDFSSTVLNPAGIGVYRSSELTFSPTFLQTNNDARFYNNPTEEGRLNFNIGSIGYVAVKEMDQNGWKSLNFGIGYSRTNSFSREYNLRSSGINDTTSLIYSHTNTLNTLQNPITQDQITARYPAEIGPAYETFLLDEIGNGFYDVRFWDASGIAKSYDVINRGGSGDLNLTVGGNYKDKLYVGAAVAFSIVNFNEQTTYREDMIYSSPADSTQVAAGFPRSTDFTRKSTLDVSGAGVNLKLGVIYRPVDFVRLGASIQSPTWLSLDETFSNSYESNFENGENYFFDYFSEFSYQIHTPWRTNLGLGLILGKKAVFSADYEYLNYSNARIRDAIDPIVEFGFDEANQEIKKDFSRAHNVRFGLEYRINAPYSLRAGFRYNDNPLNDQIADDLSSRTFSIGGGYKNENGVFVDFAYSLRQYGETVRLNAVDFNNQAGQGALLVQNSHLIQFTLGLRF